MKQFKTCVSFSLFVICALLSLSAAIFVFGENVHKGGLAKSSSTVPDKFDIHGTVMDITPDLSPKTLDKLEQAASEISDEKFGKILDGMYDISSPVPNVVVKAQGDSVTEKAVTDSQGKFEFIGLPGGEYELSAEMPSRFFGTGEKRMATGKKRIELDTNYYAADLQLRADLVVVRGRITDAQGQPVADAKVRGQPYPMPDSSDVERTYPVCFAVSGVDGSYELRGFVPLDIYRMAGYLAGGDPTEFGLNPFYVKVYVEAAGFVQDKTKVPRVPLVTEEQLVPARRLLKALSQMATRNGGSELREKEGLPLPPSHGNTITGVDIVLKKAGEGGH